MAAGSFGGVGVWRVRDLRISREFHLLVGEAELAGGVPIRVARIAWWMEPESRIAGHRAVVESASVTVSTGARLLADSVLAGRRGFAACDGVALLADTLGGGVFSTTGVLPPPPEWGAGSDGPAFDGLRLGWLGAARLAAVADLDLSGGGVLDPGCTDCWSGLVFGSGQVRVVGSGAGVLAIDGDLAFAGGAAWTGLVLVSGDMVFESGASLLGLLRVGGEVTLAANTEMDGSACAALEALNAAPSLLRPVTLPGRSWMGPVPPGRE